MGRVVSSPYTEAAMMWFLFGFVLCFLLQEVGFSEVASVIISGVIGLFAVWAFAYAKNMDVDDV